jgi:hypothetical protein
LWNHLKFQGWFVGKQYFRRTDKFNPGAEVGMVELVELSKIPVIVGCKRFFESTKLNTSGVEEVTVSLVGVS